MTEARQRKKTWLLEDPGWAAQLASSMSVDDMTLIADEGPHAGQQMHLEREIIHVGRGEWCDFQLPLDMRVSSIHCELHLEPNGVRLIDRNSRNGVMVAGCRIFNAWIPPNLPFRVGDSVLRLQPHHTKTEIQVQYQDASGQLVGQSPRMRQVFSMLSRLGPSDVPVLFLGETGTGKSSIAQSLHQQSRRKHGPFVTVNCGALPSNLIESELFGYEKGAFTGANQSHPGLFEQAHGGTLFLDEIGELPLEMQPKLLDILERKKVRRLGGTQERAVDFRLLTATHRDLRQQVGAGTFREDLFYRLAVMELEVPALRERLEDLPLLARSILQDLSEKPVHLSSAAIHHLQQHLWPGNVRELRNILERSLIWIDDDTITPESLHLPAPQQLPMAQPLSTATALYSSQDAASAHHPSALSVSPSPAETRFPATEGTSFVLQTMDTHIAEAERQILCNTLEAVDWNVSKAMRVLKVSRSWMYGRLNRYGIERPEDK